MPRLHELFRKVRANFWPLPCDTSQEPNGSCSEELVQMNFLILGGFFRVDFPALNVTRMNANRPIFESQHNERRACVGGDMTLNER